MTPALFSQRYFHALEQQTLTVEIPDVARRKLWTWLGANNDSVYIQRDPNDRWISNSSILEETEYDLLVEQGWDKIPGAPAQQGGNPFQNLRHLVLSGEAPFVFDTMELAGRRMEPALKEAFQQKANQIFELHGCLWRMSDGEFFKLDGDFVGARLASTAHDALAANHFAGATDEYAKARQYLATGEIREAIYFAGHSFESILKVLAGPGSEHANADRLLKDLSVKGYFDDLPDSVRAGFTDQVLKALPFLRNKLGGHGQGAAIVTVPVAYGELAVQLAAVLHNFLVSKLLERTPAPPPAKTVPPPDEDELPF